MYSILSLLIFMSGWWWRRWGVSTPSNKMLHDLCLWCISLANVRDFARK